MFGQKKYWQHRPFSFLLAITKVNINLVEVYFIRHKEPRPQLEFQKMISENLINNEYFLQEKNAMELRKNKRLKTVSAHFLLTIVKSTSKYPQATCTGGHKKERTYGTCSPGIFQYQHFLQFTVYRWIIVTWSQSCNINSQFYFKGGFTIF